MKNNPMGKLLLRLTARWHSAGDTGRQEPRFQLGEGFYFTFAQVSNGYGGYRMINVCLRKTDDAAFCRVIIDRAGRIVRFPGIRKGSWTKDLEYPLDRRVRFSFWIGGFQGGRACVSWTLQPDGRYFEDEDGFGAEHCQEITVYSWLDTDGRFTVPFFYRE